MLLLKQSTDKKFKEYTAEEVAEMFDVPFKKLLKSPEFNICDSKKTKKQGQSQQISHPAGLQFHANFFFKKDGKTYELRYAESIDQIQRGEKTVEEYSPRKVQFRGAIQFMSRDEMDKIVYFYLHPHSENSPFRKEVQSAPHYYFKDLESLSTAEMENHIQFSKAIRTIESYSGDQLRLIAKSFGITGTENMPDVSVKAKLVELCTRPSIDNPKINNAKEFNKKLNSQTHLFKGIVLTAIENGTFLAKTTGGGKVWVWAKGELRGNKIVDIDENAPSESDVLLAHINENIPAYYPVLIKALKAENATNESERFLKSQAPIDLNDLFGKKSSSKIKLDKPVVSQIGGGTDEEHEEVSDVNTELKEEIKDALDKIDPDAAGSSTDEEYQENKESEDDDDLPEFLKEKPKPNVAKNTGPKKA